MKRTLGLVGLTLTTFLNKVSMATSETTTSSEATEHICEEILECANDWEYFNRLACTCLSTLTCGTSNQCPEGAAISPDSFCECKSTDYIRGLFPQWATEANIKDSEDFKTAILITEKPDDFFKAAKDSSIVSEKNYSYLTVERELRGCPGYLSATSISASFAALALGLALIAQ